MAVGAGGSCRGGSSEVEAPLSVMALVKIFLLLLPLLSLSLCLLFLQIANLLPCLPEGDSALVLFFVQGVVREGGGGWRRRDAGCCCPLVAPWSLCFDFLVLTPSRQHKLLLQRKRKHISREEAVPVSETSRGKKNQRLSKKEKCITSHLCQWW